MDWVRPEHRLIAEALGAMDAGWLLERRCFFGGGTAIVMSHGEYRRSLDVKFMCADADGYRSLREAATFGGIAAFFGDRAETLRGLRADQHGIRGVVGWKGQPIKFEIVREARIHLEGGIDALLGVPMLSPENQVAEKLLANSDRWHDPGAAFRNVFDLGFLIGGLGGRIPDAAREKAELAYGRTIAQGVERVIGRLSEPDALSQAAAALEMNSDEATRAAAAWRDAAASAWPSLDLVTIVVPRSLWDYG